MSDADADVGDVADRLQRLSFEPVWSFKDATLFLGGHHAIHKPLDNVEGPEYREYVAELKVHVHVDVNPAIENVNSCFTLVMRFLTKSETYTRLGDVLRQLQVINTIQQHLGPELVQNGREIDTSVLCFALLKAGKAGFLLVVRDDNVLWVNARPNEAYTATLFGVEEGSDTIPGCFE